jgi:hypothetical protein
MSEPPTSSSPPAGWYPDPAEPSVIRWWDGSAWTHHLQPAPQASPDLPAAPGWFTTRNAVLALAVMLVLLALGFALISGGGESGGESPTLSDDASSAQLEAADADAQADLRLAQTAIEAYATDNGGIYDGASADALGRIEPGLSAEVEIEPVGAGYTLTLRSQSGTTFSIVRDKSGVVTLSCDAPGLGKCSDSGIWG